MKRMRKLKIPSLILLFGLMLAGFIVVSDFSGSFSNLTSWTSPKWVNKQGEGFAVPACGASSACSFSGENVVCSTCNGTSPQVDFSWIDDGNTMGLQCQTVMIRGNSGTSASTFTIADSLPCSGSYSWTGGSPSTVYNYWIRYHTATDIATGQLVTYGFDAVPSVFFSDNFDQGGSGVTNGWATPGMSNPTRVTSSGSFITGVGGTKGFYFQGASSANPDDGAQHVINISNKDFLVLSYSRATQLSAGAEFIAQYSFDGVSFITLGILTGNHAYQQASFPINNPNGDPTLTIRFFINGNNSADQAAIDNLTLIGTNTGHLIAGGSFTTPICTLTSFDYSLSSSGDSSVAKTSVDVYTTKTITKTLTAGTPESVTITATGMPAGVSIAYDGNRACSPTCPSIITFTVSPSTPAGTYPITVTGSPLGKQTSFNLAVSGNPMTVSCSASPSTALLGQTVTWTATVPIGQGTPPFTYSWSGTNFPTTPPPSINPFSIIYSTIGQKTATVTVTDMDSITATCPAGVIQINFNPNLEEF